MKTKPMTMLLAMLAGWINRQQQEALEYLKEENKILRDELLKATGILPKKPSNFLKILFLLLKTSIVVFTVKFLTVHLPNKIDFIFIDRCLLTGEKMRWELTP